MSPANVRIFRLVRASGAALMSSVVSGGETVGVGARSSGDGGGPTGRAIVGGAKAGTGISGGSTGCCEGRAAVGYGGQAHAEELDIWWWRYGATQSGLNEVTTGHLRRIGHCRIL